MLILKIFILTFFISLQSFAIELCTPQVILKELRTIDNKFLPFEIQGVNRSSLVETDHFLHQVSREINFPVILLIEKIKTSSHRVFTKESFLTFAREIKSQTPISEIMGHRSLARTYEDDIIVPFELPRPVSDKEVIIPRSSHDSHSRQTFETNDELATQQSASNRVSSPRSSEFFLLGKYQKLSPNLSQISDLGLRRELSKITSIRYPAIDYDFVEEQFKRAQEYLSGLDFRKKYPDLLENIPEHLSQKGTQIGQGSFKTVYLLPNRKQVVKIVNTLNQSKQGTQSIIRSIQREIAIQDFLLQVIDAFVAAGKKAPFRVATINTDPELLRRGIILQDFIDGIELHKITRSDLDTLYPAKSTTFKPTQKQLQQLDKDELLHFELERIPEIELLQEVIDAFNDTIIDANIKQNKSILGGKIKVIDENGNVVKKQLKFGIDIGGNYRNLSFDSSKDPPLVFFDW